MINNAPMIKKPQYDCPIHVPINKAKPIKKKIITRNKRVRRKIEVIKLDKKPDTLFTVLSFKRSILVSP